MNPINLSGGGEIDPRRGVGRVELERPAEVSSGPQKSVANPPPGTDSVRVSDQAAAIGELTAKADQLPEIRQEKVERLRTEVQSGNYRPPAAEIADALLKDGAKSTVEI